MNQNSHFFLWLSNNSPLSRYTAFIHSFINHWVSRLFSFFYRCELFCYECLRRTFSVDSGFYFFWEYTQAYGCWVERSTFAKRLHCFTSAPIERGLQFVHTFTDRHQLSAFFFFFWSVRLCLWSWGRKPGPHACWTSVPSPPSIFRL